MEEDKGQQQGWRPGPYLIARSAKRSGRSPDKAAINLRAPPATLSPEQAAPAARRDVHPGVAV